VIATALIFGVVSAAFAKAWQMAAGFDTRFDRGAAVPVMANQNLPRPHLSAAGQFERAENFRREASHGF